MKFENTQVWGFEHALRGMRNPKNSWSLSDSYYNEKGDYIIGPKDMKLARTLIKGGPEHRKFLRQIFVSVDITAGLVWWKEMDTYKIGTVANSTSTMHKLTSKPITLDCFETDDYNPDVSGSFPTQIIDYLEVLRQNYLRTNDKKVWLELVRWLPESWLQTRTVTMNYENLLSICHQRRYHKLNYWSGQDDPSKPNFIAWARTLPYAQEFIFPDENESNEEKIEKVGTIMNADFIDLSKLSKEEALAALSKELDKYYSEKNN